MRTVHSLIILRDQKLLCGKLRKSHTANGAVTMIDLENDDIVGRYWTGLNAIISIAAGDTLYRRKNRL
jgi:hypothetical protein